jgi:hypothetical protein
MGTNLINNFVTFEEQTVCINVLGLRGLKSSGVLPIKKARIEFGMKSLIEPRSDRDLSNIKTQPGPAGPDPTLSTIIKFKIGMPIGGLYSPVMPCYVTDQIF